MQPGYPGRPGHAAQAEQRHPPHIIAQAQAPRDPGIQRRHRQSGDRRRDEHVEILWLQARLIQRAYQRLTPEVHGVFDEDPVCLAEVGQRWIPFLRQDEVATVDFGAGMQLSNDVFVTLELLRNADKQVGQLSLGIAIRRQRTKHTGNDAHWSHPLATRIAVERFNRFKRIA